MTKKSYIFLFLNFLKRKRKLIIILVVIIIFFIYYNFQSKAEDDYFIYNLSPVNSGIVFASVSGSGQVSSLNQTDVKSQTVSIIDSINVSSGQLVSKGDILITLDSRDLEKRVNDTYRSYLIAKNNLDLKLSDPSEEEVILAKNNYNNAKISYEKSIANLENIENVFNDNVRKAENDIEEAKRNYELVKLETESRYESNSQDIINAYNSAKHNLDSSFLSLRSAIVLADNILGLNYYNSSDSSHYINVLGARDSSSLIRAKNAFYLSKQKMEQFNNNYEVAHNYEYHEIEEYLILIEDALLTSKDLMSSLYNTLVNTITSSTFSQSQLDSFKNSVTSNENSLLSSINNIRSSSLNIEKLKLSLENSDLSNINNIEKAKNTLENAKLNLEKIVNDYNNNYYLAEVDIDSKKMAYELAKFRYENIFTPPREIDLTSSRVQLSQSYANYLEAKDNLDSSIIRSPINGKIAKINYKVGDSVGGGNTIMTVISDDKLVELNFNEIDIAKIKIGQKVNLSFNAIPNLYITGEVIEVDSLGSVNQGVISYGVKVSLDVNDDRVKPQMSVSADIIIDESVGVLFVPNSAIKRDLDGSSYVEYFELNDKNITEIITDEMPEKKYIEIGLVGDVNTEVIDGLNKNDYIIIRSSNISNSNINSANTQNSSIFDFSGSMPSGSMRMMR